MFKTKFNRSGFNPLESKIQETSERKMTLKVQAKLQKGDDRRMGLKFGLGFGPTGNRSIGPMANKMTVFTVQSHSQ